MKEVKVTMTNLQATLAAVVALPFIAVTAIMAMALHGMEFWSTYNNVEIVIVCITALLAMIPHELIHAAVFMACGKKCNKVIFGMKFPFCAYTRFEGKLARNQYVLGCISPFLLLALLPMLVGAVVSQFGVFLLGVLMALGSGSDLYIAYCAASLATKHDFICDAVAETGFIIVQKEED